MKFTEEHYRTIAETLKKVVTSDDVKLEWGLRQRQAIKDQLSKGLKVEHYRVAWIKSARDEVIEAVKKKAVKKKPVQHK